MRFYKLLIFVLSFSFLLVFSSCNFRPQPDKIVEMTVTFEGNDHTNQKIDTTIETLRKRVKKITNMAEVTLVDNAEIKIKASIHFEAERFRNYMLNQGKLDFYETYSMKDLGVFMSKVNQEAKIKKESEDNPLLSLIKAGGYEGGPVLFYVAEKDTAEVNKLIGSKSARVMLSDKKRFIQFLWGVKENDDFPLYAVKKNRLGKPSLSGDAVINAFMNYNAQGMPVIAMQMNEEGAVKWEDLTGKTYAQKSHIAIVINNQVFSAPGVSHGPIKGGKSEISGDFTIEEAQDFANILVSGEIPKMKLIDFEVKKIN